jgi:hypothetical protein
MNFTPRVRAPGTHWLGGWVGLRVGLDKVARTESLPPCRESNPRRLSHSLVTTLSVVSRLLATAGLTIMYTCTCHLSPREV